MTDQTPNSTDQLMAKVLESVLLTALKPIVSRLDRLEDLMIDQSPVRRDQLSYALDQQTQEILSHHLNNNQSLSDALTRLTDRLEQWEIERNQQLATLVTQVQALTEAHQQQELKVLAIALDNLVSNLEQQTQRQNELSSVVEQLSDVVEKLSHLLMNAESL